MALKVIPSRLEGEVMVPPSKSYTHRAITIASMADGTSTIHRALLARDTWASIRACRALGANVKVEEKEGKVVITGGLPFSPPPNVIDVENSGTTIRLLCAACSLMEEGYAVLTGDESIRRRPMQPLLSALQQLGVECWSTRLDGRPPVIVKGGGLRGGNCNILGTVSSQFISALLIAGTASEEGVRITVEGEQVSRPYIEATISCISSFGGEVERLREGDGYRIRGGQKLTPQEYFIPGDFSSASLLMACALLSGGSIRLKGLELEKPQGDAIILKLLKDMGVGVKVLEGGRVVEVTSPGGRLKARSFSLRDYPDLVPVIAVLALICDGTVSITEVGHLRYKESDRIATLARGLRALGARVEEGEEGLKIEPPARIRGCSLDAEGDHRIFMAFLAASLGSEGGCIIKGEESIDVSYPTFLEDVIKLGANVVMG